MENAKKLLPENDLQELWGMNSRREAAIDYIQADIEIPWGLRQKLLAILGYQEGA